MKCIHLALLIVNSFFLQAQSVSDWLIQNQNFKAKIVQRENSIVLSNGLIERKILLYPNASTISYLNVTTNEQLIRSVRPEAEITLNNVTYQVGGLYGQSEHAYLENKWIPGLTSHSNDFHYYHSEIDTSKPHFDWKCDTWSSNKKMPTGKSLKLFFKSNKEELHGITVIVHYDLFDGLPVLSKWVEIKNRNIHSLKINQVKHEILALVEEESAVVGSPEKMKKPQKIYFETNYAYNNAMRYELSDHATHWKTDSSYTSQVNYNYETPCVVEIYPEVGVGIDLLPNESFKSIRTYELALDSYDRERNGLARRKMYRTLFPWTNQNPIFMHLISTDPVKVKSIVDQCVETGYEMVILSFGSGLNMEDDSEANIHKFKELADYAHSKGIKLGGYSLFSSRRIDDENDVIDPVTGLPDKGAFFGHAPCLGSTWGIHYIKKLKNFFDKTGFDILEHDGPYPGDVCASTKHPGHQGLEDSQWRQMQIQKQLYQYLNGKGVYINAPDWYFLDGSNKIALGYREVNFSLSREQQKILNRQNIYDGFWDKTPSMGWGFVPLTKYQGGGPEAILEPLSDHIEDYKQLMIQYYGADVQACYRGPRLYDNDHTKKVVKETIEWYKKYRDILNSDIIHLRRADGRDWDGILHANPQLKEKGFALFYNSSPEAIIRKIKLPLYYTGLRDKAAVSIMDKNTKLYKVNRDYSIDLEVQIPGAGYTWMVIR